jgi:hypothetical protein
VSNAEPRLRLSSRLTLFSVDLPGIEPELLPGNMPCELRFRSVPLRFSPARCLPRPCRDHRGRHELDDKVAALLAVIGVDVRSRFSAGRSNHSKTSDHSHIGTTAYAQDRIVPVFVMSLHS